jgi:glucan phosphoethanolaminetransferase (alkaline phosphatase superfamily)
MQEKRLLRKLNFIEIYQFFGGIIGLFIMTYLVCTTNAHEYAGPFYIFIILSFLFFGFCMYSAWLLNKKNYLRGLNLVIISLILQLVAFEFCGIYFTSVNGIALNFTLDLTNDTIVGFDFQPSQFIFAFRENEDIFHFKLNLFACGMLFYTAKIIKEVKTSLYSII